MGQRRDKKLGRNSTIATILLLAIAAIVGIGLIASRFGWPLYLEILSHFQRQYFVVSLVLLMAIAVLQQRRLFAIGLVLLALQGTQILPWYLPPKFIGSPTEGNLRVLVANLQDRNREYAKVLDFVRAENPDLALFIEVDSAWVQRFNEQLTDLPYTAGVGSRFSRGLALYSRYPLGDMQLQQFAQLSDISIIGTLDVNGQLINLVGTHPLPPIKPDYFQSRNRQLAEVGEYMGAIAPPKMLIGDLNITMWSPYYRRFVTQAELTNARDGFGSRPSWPIVDRYGPLIHWLSGLFSIPIDHCLLSSDLTVVDMRVGPNIGSDHHPIIVDLQVGDA
jgi:endonuclease/exonuclease/phosphatase (EEP) superfamily protein YafD